VGQARVIKRLRHLGCERQGNREPGALLLRFEFDQTAHLKADHVGVLVIGDQHIIDRLYGTCGRATFCATDDRSRASCVAEFHEDAARVLLGI
jgi:hypothetical protein